MKRQLPLERMPRSWRSDAGLGAGDVEARRRDYGRNDVVAPEPRVWLALAADSARDPMIWSWSRRAPSTSSWASGPRA